MFSRYCSAALLAICAGTALQAGILLDRGLPTANLNAAGGANRSNVAWGGPLNYNGYNWSTGDSFTIGNAGEAYTINKMTVWVIGNGAHDPLSSLFSSLSLVGGKPGTTTSASSACADASGLVQSKPCLDASGLSTIASGAPGAANVTATRVQYAGGEDYQGSSGNYRDLYQVDFTGLNWAIQGGVEYAFFVTGIEGSVGNGGNSPFLSASNAAFGGVTAPGADNVMWEIAQNGSGTVVAMDQWDSLSNPWDKSSDVNVQISGMQTPEPATFALIGTALAGLALVRRRRA